jgi:hypothetical protein
MRAGRSLQAASSTDDEGDSGGSGSGGSGSDSEAAVEEETKAWWREQLDKCDKGSVQEMKKRITYEDPSPTHTDAPKLQGLRLGLP